MYLGVTVFSWFITRPNVECVALDHQKTLFFPQASENYILSNDTRSQLKFLEKLDQLEKQRKDLEEREMLLKAAKVRSFVMYEWTWLGKEVRISFIIG